MFTLLTHQIMLIRVYLMHPFVPTGIWQGASPIRLSIQYYYVGFYIRLVWHLPILVRLDLFTPFRLGPINYGIVKPNIDLGTGTSPVQKLRLCYFL